MPNIYFGSVQHAAVAQWAASTAYVSTSNGGRGDYVRQLAAPASGSERVFRCTTSGTSGAAEPAWVLTKNGATTDNTATWTECTGQEADQTAALWKAPHSHIENAFAATWGAAGDTFYQAHDDAETRAAARTLTSPGTSASPCRVLCVNATTGSSMPPVSADLRTTGTINTTGASNITIGGVVSECNGVQLLAGSAANAASIVPAATAIWHFKNSALKLNNTSNSSRIQLGSNGGSSLVTLTNTPMTFGAVAQGVVVYGSRAKWRNTASAIVGSVPTTLFPNDTDRSFDVLELENVDLSAATSGKTIFGAIAESATALLRDCALGSGVTIAASGSSIAGLTVLLSRADSSGTNYRQEKYTPFLGNQVIETTLIRTGGASNGTTGISQKITATANTKWELPFENVPLAVWNDTTAANVTVTVEGLQDPRTSTSLPNNDDVWMEVNYFGSAATPIGTSNSGTKADILATGAALTASTQAWDSLVTARANSTAYSLGDRIKVASNTGRVFICTTAGTSSGSEPAGYASAVDGGSVTDNTATFTAAVRFKQAITLSSPQPAMKGYIYVTPKVGKASGIYYIDPKPVLS